MNSGLDPQPRQSLRLLLREVQLKSATLQIRTALGKTVWLTVLLFILLTAIAEWVALRIFSGASNPTKNGLPSL